MTFIRLRIEGESRVGDGRGRGIEAVFALQVAEASI